MQSFGLARLGRDVELKYTPTGEAVATLALAFDYGKKENGKRPVQWVSATLWGKRAEALAQYLVKGQQVCVSLDDLHIRTWDKPDGSQGYALEGRVSAIEFAGSAPQQQSQPAAASRAQSPGQRARQAQQEPASFDDFDEPIPF